MIGTQKDKEVEYSWKKLHFVALLCSVILAILGCEKEQSGRRQNVPVSEKAAQIVSDKILPESSSLAVASREKPEEDSSNFSSRVSPAVLSLALSPQVVCPGTPIRAEAEADEADSSLVLFDYEWRRNGEVLTGEFLNELDTTSFRKGDLISVTVTPFVGESRGEPKRSKPVVILNRPPEINSFPPSGAGVDGKYVYEVRATDPDEDPLEFSLEEAPAGMSIEQGTGRLQWDIPASLEGEFQVRIIASDGDAQAFQGFAVHVNTN